VTLGATVPVVLSGRGESMEVRMASCVLASLVAAHVARTKSSEQKPQSPDARVASVAA
jgi:hypothetical protein